MVSESDTDYAAPKADGFNPSSDGDLLARSRERSKSGEWPLRKRGYWRALARQEEWAVKLSQKGPFGWWLSWVYRPSLLREVLASPPLLLGLVSKDESWVGSDLIVPFQVPK